jgi:hypothetical protein
MAEIKSTLDLVMEKTRHLTMTDNDKLEQAAAEFKAALNGLIQQYLDRGADTDRFREQLYSLEQSGSFSDRGIVIGEIARRIDPDVDNRLLLDLLQSACEVDVSGIRILLEKCVQAVDREADAAHRRAMEELGKRGISGSAVVPNFHADKAWGMKRNEIVEQCREALKAEMRRLAVE